MEAAEAAPLLLILGQGWRFRDCAVCGVLLLPLLLLLPQRHPLLLLRCSPSPQSCAIPHRKVSTLPPPPLPLRHRPLLVCHCSLPRPHPPLQITPTSPIHRL